MDHLMTKFEKKYITFLYMAIFVASLHAILDPKVANVLESLAEFAMKMLTKNA